MSENHVLSRRNALAGLGAGGLAVALSAPSHSAAAQSVSTAEHPLTGSWLGLVNPALMENPPVYSPATFGADGSVILMFPLSDVGERGVLLQCPYIGVWEPYDEQRGHFTATQVLSAPDGTPLGTVTVDGHTLVSEDGQTFSDDGVLNTVTIRDAAGNVVMVIPPGEPVPRPVTGRRMTVGNAGFPDELESPGTPTS